MLTNMLAVNMTGKRDPSVRPVATPAVVAPKPPSTRGQSSSRGRRREVSNSSRTTVALPSDTPVRPRNQSRPSGTSGPGEKRKRDLAATPVSPQQRKTAKLREKQLKERQPDVEEVKLARRKRIHQKWEERGWFEFEAVLQSKLADAREQGKLEFATEESVLAQLRDRFYEQYRKGFESDYVLEIADKGLEPEQRDNWPFELVAPREPGIFVLSSEGEGEDHDEDEDEDPQGPESDNAGGVQDEIDSDDDFLPDAATQDRHLQANAAMSVASGELIQVTSESEHSPSPVRKPAAKGKGKAPAKKTPVNRKSARVAKPQAKPKAKPKEKASATRPIDAWREANEVVDEAERLKTVAANLVKGEAEFVEVEYRAGERIPKHETAQDFCFALWFGDGNEDLDKTICARCARNLSTKATKYRLVCNHSGKHGTRCNGCAKSKKLCVHPVSATLGFAALFQTNDCVA